jgi:DNA-binding NarL/FixJ family response regulator
MSGTEPIRVLVVDDHAVVREGIRHVLSEGAGFVVVGEARSGTEAVASAAELRPNVVVLDISMPGGSGLRAAGELIERVPEIRVLMLSVHDDIEYVHESIRAGAHGYLRKDSAPADLRAAVRALHEGGEYYSPEVERQLTEAKRRGGRAPASPPLAASVLTPREQQILIQVAAGRTNREIGAELGISSRTVEAHRESLMMKLGVRTVAGLTRLAIAQGLLAPPPSP